MPPVLIEASVDALKEFIFQNDFIMFSLSKCPFCMKAKELFRNKKIVPNILEVDESQNSYQLKSSLFSLTGQRTFPSIFAYGNHLGGCDDVVSLEDSKMLDKALEIYKKRKNLEESQTKFDYDAIVIGGGSGGLAFAKEMANGGKNVALFDYVVPSPMGTKWGLGGTCVNVGCIPKKLLHQASILGENFKKSVYYGFTMPSSPIHNWSTLIDNSNNYIKSLNFAYRSQLRKKNVEYINALAKFSGKHEVSYKDSSGNEKKLTAKYFVIACGERPDIPDIPGKEYCITSDDLFWLKYPPGDIFIVGASYVALESAGALHGLGFNVTVLVRSIFLRGYDQEMADRIGNHLKDIGVKIIRPGIPIQVESLAPIDKENNKPGKLRITYKMTDSDETLSAECNTVMFAIGRVSCTQGIGLENIGIPIVSRSRISSVDNREQTICENVFAIGDVLAGKPQLTPVAIKAGLLLAGRLCKKTFENCDYSVVPTTVFTPLEYGAIGYSEESAIAHFGKDDIEVFYNDCTPLEERIVEDTDAEIFYAKLICRISQNKKIIGLHILAPNAGEITQGYTVAIRMGATLTDFMRTFGIHPTVSEVFTGSLISKSSNEAPDKSGC